MNIDFHYYGTFLAARIAGFEKKEAMVIAHSAQYVDESNASMIDSEFSELKKLLGDDPQETVMDTTEYKKYYKSNPTADWNDNQLVEIQRAWMPFHFLPGNLNYAITYQGKSSDSFVYKHWDFGGKQQEIFKLMCTSNSDTVEFMINDTRKYYDGVSKNLHMIGLRMHVLADTWSHKNYVARPEWFINDAGSIVEELYNGSWRELSFNYLHELSIPLECMKDSPEKGEYGAAPPAVNYDSTLYLGHGRMGHLPDYPYLHYKYSPQWKSENKEGTKGIIEKNNPEDFMFAFRQMVQALKCIKSNTPFKVNDYAQLKINEKDVIQDVQAVINTRKIEQSLEWNHLIAALDEKHEILIEFKKNTWKEAFNAAADQDKIKTDYYLFNKAALDHLKCIKDFLKTYNLDSYLEKKL